MFDTIYVKKKLPLTKELKALNVEWDELDFQTKDLENLLDSYEITKAGKLKHFWQKRKWKDDDDAFLKGYFEVVEEEWRDVKHHGTITFYTSICDSKEHHWDLHKDEEQLSYDDIELIEGNDWWVEFEATFTKGKLDEIRLIKANKTPVKERVLNTKNWAMKRAEEEKKISRRVVKFLRKSSLYRGLIHNTIKFENFLHSKVNRILYKL